MMQSSLNASKNARKRFNSKQRHIREQRELENKNQNEFKNSETSENKPLCKTPKNTENSGNTGFRSSVQSCDNNATTQAELVNRQQPALHARKLKVS